MDFDINDYKLKTELTSDKLFVAVVSALRSYSGLHTLENNNKGLERIIESSAYIFKQRRVNDFSTIMSKQLLSILCMNDAIEGKKSSGFTATSVDGSHMMTSCFGIFNTFDKLLVEDVVSPQIKELLDESIKTGKKQYRNNEMLLYIKGDNTPDHLIYTVVNHSITEWEKNLIEIFSVSIQVALNNLYLSNEVESTQKEIIFTLGEVAEARSQEMGNHVKRVSEYCRLLATGYGLSEDEIELMAMAAPVHDIGKLTIPDAILNKPGRLTIDEFEIMKTHANAGYNMMKNSQRPIINAASIIALQHHEKWDGTGYPMGLAGEHIHIFGRIVALADVFDALGSDRVYKKAWPLDRIIELIQNERGRHFDPQLVDIFMNQLSDFIKIRDDFGHL